MTIPGVPADNINRGPLQDATSVIDDQGSVPALATLDQPIAEGLLKQLFVQDNESINGPLGLIFAGLRSGISLPLAIIEALLQQLFNVDGIFTTIEQALAFIKEVPILGDLVEVITGIAGAGLEVLGDFFDGVPILGDLVEAMTGVLDGDLSDLQAFFENLPLIGDLLQAITGGSEGGLGFLTSWFDDFTGLLGSPLGLGSGTPTLGAVQDIPILGPAISAIIEAATGIIGGDLTDLASLFEIIPFVGDLVAMITGGSGDLPLSFLGDWFADLIGILGNPTGLGSGIPGLNLLDNIPILGPAITGITNAITGIFGGDLTDLSSFFDNVPLIGDLVEVITGVVGGDFTDLSLFFDNVPLIGDIVEAITGTVGGDFTDLSSFFDNVPLIGDLVEVITGVVGGDFTDLTSWADDLADRIQNLLSGGLFDASALTNLSNIPVILQTRISGLLGDLADRLRISGTNGSTDFFNRLRNQLLGTSGLTGTTATSLAAAAQDLIEAITSYPNNFTNTVRMGIERFQEMEVLANRTLTAFNAEIQRVKDWWDAEDWVWW